MLPEKLKVPLRFRVKTADMEPRAMVTQVSRSKKLRTQFILGVGLLVILLVGMIGLISRFVLLSGYDSLENRNALRTGDRIEKVLQVRLEALTAAAEALSVSCRTRPLAQVFSKTDSASAFHGAVIIDSHGSILQSAGRPFTSTRSDNTLLPISLKARQWVKAAELQEQIRLSPVLKRGWGKALSVGDSLVGLVSLVPWKSQTSGKSGFLATVQVLNNTHLGDLGRLNNLNSALDVNFENVAGTSSAAVTKLQDGILKISVPLINFSSRTFATLDTKVPQTILSEGKDNITALIFSVSVTTIAVGLMFWMYISRTVLRRLETFTSDVQNVGERVDKRVGVDSTDEIGWLATQVNKMLERQAAAQREIERREELLRQANENLETVVEERTARLGELNSVLENAVEGIARFNPTGKILEANTTFAAMLGFVPDEIIGQNWEQMMSFSDLDRVYHELEKSIAENAKTQFDTECIRRDSSHAMLEVTAIPQRDEEGAYAGMYWFVRDITERKRLEARITFQAFNDELTGLPNRSMFTAHLETELRGTHGNNELAVLLFDVDNFKYVNDSYGHSEGDRLLGLFADRLRDLSPRGAVLARISGDEFAMLVPNCSPDMAADVANLVFRKMRPPIILGNREVFISCTIGIALNNEECDTVEKLFKGAETAMYEAKSRGKAGFAMYHSAMNENILERMEIEVGLRRAIELNEFRLVYQPIVDLATGATTGAEALVRWNHPERGAISPAKFVPIAEETGLIIPLGEWVLKQACNQTRRILDEFPDSNFVMSINLSARQLLIDNLSEVVMNAINSAGIRPQNLKIEITESAMMEDVEVGIARLEGLRELGLQLAVDDFGTGHSSLSYLRRLPVHNVKIDQSFVSMLGVEKQPTAIVKAIISLCQALELNVTGEGIETTEQRAVLTSLGCDYGQGYLFAKPLDEKDFVEQCMTDCHWQRAA